MSLSLQAINIAWWLTDKFEDTTLLFTNFNGKHVICLLTAKLFLECLTKLIIKSLGHSNENFQAQNQQSQTGSWTKRKGRKSSN